MIQRKFIAVMSVDSGRTAGWWDEIQQDVDGGCFTGTICTQQAKNLTRLDAITDMIQGQNPALNRCLRFYVRLP